MGTKDFNKKGFTLLELIAITVILSFIFLIITPYILKIVENSRYQATKASAIAYLEASEKAAMIYIITNPHNNISRECLIDKNLLNCGETTLKLDLKGDIPSSGTLFLKTNGTVEKIKDLLLDGYVVNYSSGTWNIK